MHDTHTTTSRVENSAQVLSSQLKFVYGLTFWLLIIFSFVKKIKNHSNLLSVETFNAILPTGLGFHTGSGAGLLNKSLCLALALGVTKLTNFRDIIWSHLIAT